MGLLRGALLRMSTNRRLARWLPRLWFVRRAVRRFMPGEELEDALREAERLRGCGATALLTLLGENVADATEAAEVVDHYVGALDEVSARGLEAELSVKPTHLGLDLGADVAERGLDRLTEAAQASGNFVWIDMESSAYVEPTLRLFRRVRQRRDNVGVCLQAYLHRTPDDVEALRPLRPAIRLVKGAYAEPPELAFPRREEVDRRYLELADRLLQAAAEGGGRAAFGTHDPTMVEGVRERAARLGLPPVAWEIEMLYGIAPEYQERLIREGTPLRILISYGPAWFPWYVRRLAERPANLWFVVRSLLRR